MHGSDGHYAQSQADHSVHHLPGDTERIQRDQARGLRAHVPVLPAQHTRRERGDPRVPARALDQLTACGAGAVRAGRAQDRNLARPLRHHVPAAGGGQGGQVIETPEGTIVVPGGGGRPTFQPGNAGGPR